MYQYFLPRSRHYERVRLKTAFTMLACWTPLLNVDVCDACGRLLLQLLSGNVSEDVSALGEDAKSPANKRREQFPSIFSRMRAYVAPGLMQLARFLAECSFRRSATSPNAPWTFARSSNTGARHVDDFDDWPESTVENNGFSGKHSVARSSSVDRRVYSKGGNASNSSQGAGSGISPRMSYVQVR